jgi:hypothetical protein
MLRTAVLLFGILALVIGACLCTTTARAAGMQVLASGALLIIGLVFERWRYKNKAASRSGNWQPTGERFVDPESGQKVQVLYDAQSGERRYEPLTESRDRPD